MGKTPQAILLNIGIELTPATSEITECTIRLHRNGDAAEDGDAETLEASVTELSEEEWRSGNGSTRSCMCVTLEVDPEWKGPVMLEVETNAGTYSAGAHLHAGLNSFYIEATRLRKPRSGDGRTWRRIGTWALWTLGALLLTLAIWMVVESLSERDAATVQDRTAADTLSIDTTKAVRSDSAAIAPMTDGDRVENYPAPRPAYPAYTEPALEENAADEATDSTASDQPEPPRKENNYGIEE